MLLVRKKVALLFQKVKYIKNRFVVLVNKKRMPFLVVTVSLYLPETKIFYFIKMYSYWLQLSLKYKLMHFLI